MKTTVDIPDALASRAKQLAAARGVTLKALITEGLKRVLDEDIRYAASVEVQTRTFAGQGLQPGLEWGDWDAIRARAYEGRGG
jgi:hypothetical protein